MKSSEISIKVKTALNKLDSQDYQNVDLWIIQQEYNKATIDLVREILRGVNIRREGKENSISTVEDLQILLKPDILSGLNKEDYFRSQQFNKDYLAMSRVTPKVVTSFCNTLKRFPSALIEDSNVDEYLYNTDTEPSYEYEQCFHVLFGNRIKLYHKKDFEVKELDITYYRMPRYVTFPNAPTPDGGVGKDDKVEFKEDFVELIIERTIQNISGYFESLNKNQLSEKRVNELK